MSYSVYLVKNRAGFFLDFEHPTCKGKSMGKWLAFTFALTGRRGWGHGTQGVALGSGLAGLSARAGPQTGLFRTISTNLIFQF